MLRGVGPFSHREADMTAGLSPQLRDCLLVIREHIANHRASPTYREIADALGMASPSHAYVRVRELEERGYLTRAPGRKCSIALVDHDAIDLPRKLRRRLAAYCRDHGERPADVLAQLLSDFFEDLDRSTACPGIEVTDLGLCRLGELGEVAP
jgi:hypothetical protein